MPDQSEAEIQGRTHHNGSSLLIVRPPAPSKDPPPIGGAFWMTIQVLRRYGLEDVGHYGHARKEAGTPSPAREFARGGEHSR